jgi:hypothetical protein
MLICALPAGLLLCLLLLLQEVAEDKWEKGVASKVAEEAVLAAKEEVRRDTGQKTSTVWQCV